MLKAGIHYPELKTLSGSDLHRRYTVAKKHFDRCEKIYKAHGCGEAAMLVYKEYMNACIVEIGRRIIYTLICAFEYAVAKNALAPTITTPTE